MAQVPTKQSGEKSKLSLYEMQLKIVLIITLSHFENPGLMDDVRMEHALDAGKQILVQSQKQAEVRLALGLSRNVWKDLTKVLSQAIPLLEAQSFVVEDSSAATFAGSTTSVIAGNIVPLLKDVERINDLSTIARNLLATKQEAQDLSAEAKFDQNVLKLIDVCVRVAARGFDGEGNTRTEEKWQRLVNAYKKLLITCLQFLHNFVMNNERRKLLLWMDLFGSSPCADPSFMGRVDPAAYFQPDDYVPKEQPGDSTGSSSASQHPQETNKSHKEAGASDQSGSQATTSNKALNERLAAVQISDAPPAGVIEKSEKASQEKPLKGKERANSLPVQSVASGTTTESLKQSSHNRMEIFNEGATLNGRSIVSPLLTASNFVGLSSGRLSSAEDDEIVAITPDDATRNLRFAKEQLVDRLFGRQASETRAETEENQTDETDEAADISDRAAQGSVDDDDDEVYHGPGDQERGLLTDIPLVLGPNEIEALPMIIQTGIVDAFASKNPEGIHENMQAIRCNILISQESGRYLLRELLIFIAAWDLAEDEVYYKMMVQIMDSILLNGLVPYTYSSFAENKDIISPAQAVIIKLLTQIFRGKLAKALPSAPDQSGRLPFLRVHVLAIRFIFAHFRQSIIPETCGLIYIQGQIRAGQIKAEEFPLNLWDVERVYEGVYQYLEFFAVLTEIDGWKRLLVKWEITFELISLLQELEEAIPKGQLPTRNMPTTTNPTNGNQGAGASQTTTTTHQPKPISVERPFDRNPPSPPTTNTSTAPENSPVLQAADNPEEFEWRNLKKLVVLVLSSLTWKSAVVQNQVRKHGGVELILQCCNYDSHNPYIREHAIMCLRFLLEGNEENQQIVRELEAEQVVPSEVLDQRGYETFIDSRGKVGLRRKEEEGG
ncbi:MAG: copper transport protein [Peltula sp. TS41687]|nr:MAG: copper transport protein [Peltula sp. TS41687]